MTTNDQSAPDAAAMTAALTEALAAPEPGRPCTAPAGPQLSPDQDKFLTALLYRTDVRATDFARHHRGTDFLNDDGTLDEQRLAAAVVTIARRYR